jgi:hypothetical protein
MLKHLKLFLNPFKMTENELSNKIIGITIEIHPGLLESAYEAVLTYDLRVMDSGAFFANINLLKISLIYRL